MDVAVPARAPAARPGRQLPAWASVLALVAHPDDESFGLGAVIHALAAGGAAVHILCYTHGEASTLTETRADLRRAREQELAQAGAELGAASVTLLDYPDGRLAEIAPNELAAHAAAAAARGKAGGLLVFDETGITGHPDHRAATAAGVLAGQHAGLPVLAWALPQAVAGQLKAETGHDFAGQPPCMIDLCVRVSRDRQRRAAQLHASQVSPGRSCGGASSCRASASTCAGLSRQSHLRQGKPCGAMPGARPGPGCRSLSARPQASARAA